MKFTLSWLKTHLDTSASVAEVAAAMTMAGLEVEHVDDPGAKLGAFSVAKIVKKLYRDAFVIQHFWPVST